MRRNPKNAETSADILRLNSWRGVTIVEMVVVMAIIGLLASLTLLVIDRIRERRLFEETMAEMRALVRGITGNEEALSDGKRVDFGYVGDMGKLPDTLGALVHPEGGLWKGPYVKIPFTGDVEGYKRDAWGRFYEYRPADLTLRSFANGRVTLTSKIAQDSDELFNNVVFGQVLDRENAPPGEFSAKIKIKIRYPREGEERVDSVVPTRAGSYQFSGIPIGRHKVELFTPYCTLEKYAVVTPRTRVLVDFKLPLVLSGPLIYRPNSSFAFGPDTNNISFTVDNFRDDTVKVFWWRLSLDTFGYYERIVANGTVYGEWLNPRMSSDSIAVFVDTLRFLPKSAVVFRVGGFHTHPILSSPLSMKERKVKIRTSDGSLIRFVVGRN